MKLNNKNIIRYLLIILTIFLSGCAANESEKTQVKDVISKKIPNFETIVQDKIKKIDGFNEIKNGRWLWEISRASKNYKYEARYGYYPHYAKYKLILGDIIADFTGTITFGFFSYHPFSSKRGLYIKILVNTKDETAIVAKQ